VGVVNLGAASVAVTRSMFQAAGVPTTPETFVPVGLGEQALLALRADKVQALGLWSNAYYQMERAGHKFRYFRHPTLSEFGNVALMASDKGLAERRRELCGFSRAVARASLFIVENPEAALRMYWVAVPSAKLGADDAEALRNGMREILPQAKDLDVGFPPSARFGAFDQASFRKYMDLLKEYGLANQVPPIGEVVTDALVGCMNEFDSEAVRKLARGWKK
jgi:NitT/TauT family transport system substrate-binding protein